MSRDLSGVEGLGQKMRQGSRYKLGRALDYAWGTCVVDREGGIWMRDVLRDMLSRRWSVGGGESVQR